MANQSPSIDVNVVQGSIPNDLRATYQAIATAFNIKTPDFFAKLGDLMLSSGTFSPAQFQQRFFGLITQYSQGVVYQGKAGDPTDIAPADLTPSQANVRSGKVPISVTAPTPRTQEFSISSSTVPVVKTATNQIDVNINTATNNTLATANKIGAQNSINIFLYNTLPYIATGALMGVVQTGQSCLGTNPASVATGALGSGISSVLTGGNPLSNAFGIGKYYSPDELVYLAAANFYSLFFKRGIKIKDLTVAPSTPFDPVVNIYTTTPDAIYKSKAPDLNTALKNYLNFGFSIPQKDATGRDNTAVTINLTNGNNIDPNNSNISSIKGIDGKSISNASAIKYSDGTGNTGLLYDTIVSTAKQYRGQNIIGSVYVWPVDPKAGSPGLIPFELNPVIEEGDNAAKYQAQSILSRIGELQSYTGTSSLTITVSTTYWALGEKDNEQDWDKSQLDHLSYFTLQRLQKLELAYRSIVLPFFPTDNTASTGYRYMRPPLIKIIMGKYTNYTKESDDSTASPYNNLLRYPSAVMKDRFQKVTGIRFRTFRTFICTSVKIGKSFDDFPIYYDSDNGIMDTHGYTVDMSLTEIAPSYIESLPTFSDFYNGANNIIQPFGQVAGV
jgi:hypothetical protein